MLWEGKFTLHDRGTIAVGGEIYIAWPWHYIHICTCKRKADYYGVRVFVLHLHTILHFVGLPRD